MKRIKQIALPKPDYKEESITHKKPKPKGPSKLQLSKAKRLKIQKATQALLFRSRPSGNSNANSKSRSDLTSNNCFSVTTPRIDSPKPNEK